jgi:hypothetical protein
MIKWCSFLVLTLLTTVSFSQSNAIDSLPKKGSYLYYHQPAFEDNSFFLEEAINQEKGVSQYVSNFYLDNLKGGNFLYSFTHELPLFSERHQLSYSLFYYYQNSPESKVKGGGFGDINVSYHYMLSGKKSWMMVVPAVTLIIPTGRNGYGSGGLGGQFNLLMTKRISRSIVTHYNIGYTFISQADLYVSTLSSVPAVGAERDLQYKNLGASVIWYPTRKFNVMLEYVSNFLKDIKDDGSVVNRHQLTLNPGFRFAIDHNNVQIVPGISVPFIFTNGVYDRMGLFFYLSFEPQYLPFYKAKSG